MAKSTYTLDEVVSFVILGLTRYFPTSNFDKLEIRHLLRQSLDSVFDLARDNKLDTDFFTVALELSQSSFVGNIYTYVFADESRDIPPRITRALFVQSADLDPIDLVKVDELLGASKNREFQSQPVAAFLGERVQVYWGSITPAAVFLYAVERPELPATFAGSMPVTNDLIQLIIQWTIRAKFINSNMPVPPAVQLRVDEELKLTQLEKQQEEEVE